MAGIKRVTNPVDQAIMVLKFMLHQEAYAYEFVIGIARRLLGWRSFIIVLHCKLPGTKRLLCHPSKP